MMQFRTLFLVATAVTLSTPADAALTIYDGAEQNARATRIVRSQAGREGAEQTERFSQTYRLEKDGAVDLTHIAGDIRVTAGRGNEVRVEAVKRVRHRDPAEARRHLEALRIDVTHVGGRIEIRTVYPRTTGNRGFSGSVDYTLTVPQTTALSLKTVSGDISVSGIRGEVRVETTSGDVDVVDTPNLAVAKTVSGDVRARDIASASLSLGTVSGTVVATGLKVRTLDAGSVSGNLRLADLQVERLTAKTLSGDIAFEGALERGGRYEFNAHSGNVRVVLTSGTPGFELDASTFSGNVRSDFPVSIRATPESRRRMGPARGIRGTYGDASAILALRSFSGDVVITKK